jgi:glutaredoxin
MVKAFLDRANKTYETKNIDEMPDAAKQLYEVSQAHTVPVTLIEKDIICEN